MARLQNIEELVLVNNARAKRISHGMLSKGPMPNILAPTLPRPRVRNARNARAASLLAQRWTQTAFPTPSALIRCNQSGHQQETQQRGVVRVHCACDWGYRRAHFHHLKTAVPCLFRAEQAAATLRVTRTLKGKQHTTAHKLARLSQQHTTARRFSLPLSLVSLNN